jgi:hypothetical protein
VIKQSGQDGAVAHSSERVAGRRLQQLARLRITERRGRAFVAVGHRPLDAADGLIIATTGRFMADAISLIEQHNQADRRYVLVFRPRQETRLFGCPSVLFGQENLISGFASAGTEP